MSKWDTIFKTGTHTDSKGHTRAWTQADLEKLATNLDRDVPVVIRHPTDQTQAAEFGKIADIARIGDRLVVRYKDVPETLKKAVSEGLKLAKSVSIDPLKMKIRHVGLLGADQPPAIDGLGTVNFSAADSKDTGGSSLLTYTFNQASKEETVDPKDKEIKELKDKIKTMKAGKETETLQGELDQAKADLKTEQDAHNATKDEFSKYKQDREDEALVSRVDALAESGRILPAEKDKTLAFAKAMADDNATMEFAKADGTKETVTPRENYLRDLETRKEDHHGLLTEFAKDGSGPDRTDTGDFTDINSYA